jgi:hypothetical protein
MRTIVVLLLIFLVVSCNGEATNMSSVKDELFQDMFGPSLCFSKSLSIEPSSARYYVPDDSVVFFVHNQTGFDLVFSDDAFGVQGFVFDGDDQNWSEVDLGFVPLSTSESVERVLPNNATRFSEITRSFSTRGIGIESDTDVRLVIIGTPVSDETDTQCQAYGAYTDIQLRTESD